MYPVRIVPNTKSSFNTVVTETCSWGGMETWLRRVERVEMTRVLDHISAFSLELRKFPGALTYKLWALNLVR